MQPVAAPLVMRMRGYTGGVATVRDLLYTAEITIIPSTINTISALPRDLFLGQTSEQVLTIHAREKLVSLNINVQCVRFRVRAICIIISFAVIDQFLCRLLCY